MIRPAERSDHPAMNAVFRAAARELCVDAYGVKRVEAWARKSHVEKFPRAEAGGVEFYVLVRDGRVVGFGGLNLGKRYLDSLFVDPSVAGEGLGHELLAFLLGRAAAAGVEHLRLESSLNARRFYQRHGFVEVGRGELALDNGEALESVLMERLDHA